METIGTNSTGTEKKSTLEEKITRYALVVFGVLVLLIIYTFITTQSPKSESSGETNNQAQAITPTPIIPKQVQPNQATTIAKITPKPQESKPPKTIQKQQEQTEMKPDDYKIPANKKKKLTEFLPADLKENIQASLPSEAELKAMTPEERAQFQKTQKKLAVILRDLGRTEAENRQLQQNLNHAETKTKKLDDEVAALEKTNK